MDLKREPWDLLFRPTCMLNEVKKRLSSSKYFIGHKSNHWFDLYVTPYITAVCLNDVSVTLVVEDVS